MKCYQCDKELTGPYEFRVPYSIRRYTNAAVLKQVCSACYFWYKDSCEPSEFKGEVLVAEYFTEARHGQNE